MDSPFKARLQEIRHRCGLSQNVFSVFLGIGNGTYRGWKNGGEPSGSSQKKALAKLGITRAQFMGEEPLPHDFPSSLLAPDLAQARKVEAEEMKGKAPMLRILEDLSELRDMQAASAERYRDQEKALFKLLAEAIAREPDDDVNAPPKTGRPTTRPS